MQVEVVGASGAAGVGMYELRVSEEAACWHVARRWREFIQLSLDLSSAYGGVVAAPGSLALPALSRHALRPSASASLLSARSRLMSEYLSAALRLLPTSPRRGSGPPPLVRFLSAADESPAAHAAGAAVLLGLPAAAPPSGVDSIQDIDNTEPIEVRKEDLVVLRPSSARATERTATKRRTTERQTTGRHTSTAEWCRQRGGILLRRSGELLVHMLTVENEPSAPPHWLRDHVHPWGGEISRFADCAAPVQ